MFRGRKYKEKDFILDKKCKFIDLSSKDPRKPWVNSHAVL